MKGSILFVLLLCTYIGGYAQVDAPIEIVVSCPVESFKGLSNHVQGDEIVDWSNALFSSDFGSFVSINEQIETRVFVYPNGSVWISSDSSGMFWCLTCNSEPSIPVNTICFGSTFTTQIRD